MPRSKSPRCQARDLMRRFLEEDLEAPGSVFSWTAFAYWIDVDSALKSAPILDPVEGSQSEPRAREVHSIALLLLRSLQETVRAAVNAGNEGDFWEEIRDRHLPNFLHLADIGQVEVRQRWAYGEPPVGPVGKLVLLGDQRDRQTRLFPDREQVVLHHWLSLLPSFAPVQAYFSTLNADGTGPPREQVADAARLPTPYSRIFGMVCAEALLWLEELTELRCRVCGEPIKDAQRTTRETCKPAHKRALSRRRKERTQKT